jgi:hypothetical protein
VVPSNVSSPSVPTESSDDKEDGLSQMRIDKQLQVSVIRAPRDVRCGSGKSGPLPLPFLKSTPEGASEKA